MWAPVLNNLVVTASCGLFLLLPGTSPLRSGHHHRRPGAAARPGRDRRDRRADGGAGAVAARGRLPASGCAATCARSTCAGSAAWPAGRCSTSSPTSSRSSSSSTSRRPTAALNEAGRGYGAYVKAFLLWQLPHAVVAVSVITALLPAMSRAAVEERTDEVRAQLDRGLRLTVAVLVPAAALYVVLGRQVATVVFAHGEVTVGQARFIGLLLGRVRARPGPVQRLPAAAARLLRRQRHPHPDAGEPRRQRRRRRRRRRPLRRRCPTGTRSSGLAARPRAVVHRRPAGLRRRRPAPDRARRPGRAADRRALRRRGAAARPARARRRGGADGGWSGTARWRRCVALAVAGPAAAGRLRPGRDPAARARGGRGRRTGAAAAAAR